MKSDGTTNDPFGLSFLGVVIAIVVFAATRHFWFDGLDAAEKASFWVNIAVAVGTLALAIVTTVSVFETRTLIRGEDRRHQQNLAPLLIAGDQINRGESYAKGFTIRNQGTGIALNPSLRIRGEVTFHRLVLPPGTRSFTTIEEQTAFNDQHTQVERRQFESTFSWSAAYPNGSDTFWETALDNKGASVEDMVYSACSIVYYDMFGNHYETIYTDDRLDRFEWRQPRNLAARKNGSR